MTRDTKPPEAHTELSRSAHLLKDPEPAPVITTLKPRTPLELIPTMNDDGLDDLFNDMPV